MKFNIGDEVIFEDKSFSERIGVVINLDAKFWHGYPVLVQFETTQISFTTDGRRLASAEVVLHLNSKLYEALK